MDGRLQSYSERDVRLVTASFSPLWCAHYATRGRYTTPAHLRVLDAALQDVAYGGCQRLMVFMPPRHGKSELCSHYFPCVFLGQRPEARVILASYEADFASLWGWKARNTMGEVGKELWGLEVDQSSSARDRWDLAGHAGGMVTAGALGPITGKGADLLLIDDPVKGHEDANSRTQREKVWEWWQAVAQTRLEPRGRCVLIMTRWHEDDLAGRLLKSEPTAWRVISFPAYAGKDDALGREEGAPLWPERWGVAELEERRRGAGSYYWQALYQQRPAPEEGATFRRQWFRYYTNGGAEFKLRARVDGDKEQAVAVEQCWRFSTVDLAASLRDAADYTVVSTWAVTPSRQLLLLDCARQRLEGPDQVQLLRRIYSEWRPGYIRVEKVAYQLAFIQTARREGLPIRELVVDKDKLSRALPAAARMESGDVYLPEGAPWLPEFEAELLSFPRGEHDDQVDTLSAAVAEIARGGVSFG